MTEPWEWLARNIATIRYGTSDREALSDEQWGVVVDEAFAWLAQPDAPVAVRERD